MLSAPAATRPFARSGGRAGSPSGTRAQGAQESKALAQTKGEGTEHRQARVDSARDRAEIACAFALAAGSAAARLLPRISALNAAVEIEENPSGVDVVPCSPLPTFRYHRVDSIVRGALSDEAAQNGRRRPVDCPL